MSWFKRNKGLANGVRLLGKARCMCDRHTTHIKLTNGRISTIGYHVGYGLDKATDLAMGKHADSFAEASEIIFRCWWKTVKNKRLYI